jgi:hypothetical protein
MRFSNEIDATDIENIHYGDVLILANGDIVLVCKDKSCVNEHWLGLELHTNDVSCFYYSFEDFIKNLDSKIIRIVKADKLTLSW